MEVPAQQSPLFSRVELVDRDRLVALGEKWITWGNICGKLCHLVFNGCRSAETCTPADIYSTGENYLTSASYASYGRLRRNSSANQPG